MWFAFCFFLIMLAFIIESQESGGDVMNTIDISPLLTAHTLQEAFDDKTLEELGCVMCFFCLAQLAQEELDNAHCSECGMELLAPEQLHGVECPFCNHANPVPFPLEEDANCEICKAAI